MSNDSLNRTHEVVVDLDGEIDVSNVADVVAVLDAAVAAADDRVVLDMSRLTFLDSTGLAAMLTARQRMADDGRLIVLRRPPRFALALLEITGLTPLFTIDA